MAIDSLFGSQFLTLLGAGTGTGWIGAIIREIFAGKKREHEYRLAKDTEFYKDLDKVRDEKSFEFKFLQVFVIIMIFSTLVGAMAYGIYYDKSFSVELVQHRPWFSSLFLPEKKISFLKIDGVPIFHQIFEYATVTLGFLFGYHGSK